MPPIGVMPQWLWVEHRMEDLKDAIERYRQYDHLDLNIAYWLNEYAYLEHLQKTDPNWVRQKPLRDSAIPNKTVIVDSGNPCLTTAEEMLARDEKERHDRMMVLALKRQFGEDFEPDLGDNNKIGVWRKPKVAKTRERWNGTRYVCEKVE